MFGLGRLTMEALKHDGIEYGAGIGMGIATIVILIYMFRAKKWQWLWHEWLTSLDHKKIGVMYLVTSAVMLLKGLIDGLMMRAQQAMACGENYGYLHAEHFQQIFSAHGATMIFFVAMGIVFAVINLILPLQIGARDVAFPFLNLVSFYFFAVGSILLLVSLVIGVYSGAGWSGYPPLTGLKYNPWVGVDYWIWGIQISGVGSLLSGVNFLTTIIKMRCPGMTFRKLPIFVWAVLGTVVLIMFAFPILTTTLGLLSLDRMIDTHFFTPEFGGNPMLFVNLFWAWGHPEVYILVLPAFGIYSEIVPVFSKKKIFGYTSMVWAIGAIMLLSFIVWLHHFFTMGASANVNAFFGIMTMLIAIPTGVKIFNWLFTMVRGRVSFKTPMMWFMGFVILFTIGGMTGVILSLPPVDFQFHNSLFLVAHFHNVIIGGVLFGIFAAYSYWFPKFTGFRLDEKWGIRAFWCWFVGFMVAFFPLYALGMMGATRRLNHYAAGRGWHPLFVVASIGALIILLGFICQCIQLYVTIKNRDKLRENANDPWDGRTMEWSLPSPPAFYNFAHDPKVTHRDNFWEQKKAGTVDKAGPPYHDIHMPKNSSLGPWMGIMSFILGFALTWWIWWMAALSMLGIIAMAVYRMSDDHTDYYVTAEEVEKTENEILNRKHAHGS
ncbi:MAG: Cytochrome bo(3) ubiquinol oxidase subunit 1 [Chlamydiia bacterium]|nr:Cytochrome bo(3) ubiquinol oxidase subunit 1 [Chlamydiia bacterium]MCH9615325.1 Cytochrome bo(3) ubiquinol oxidase subunit 1 [Chlamydiia bacterium]MCH9628353.1 Cytochrome bo(3) ubiquinol oxidase subunit 1 [Chlamydiia bacterium]